MKIELDRQKLYERKIANKKQSYLSHFAFLNQHNGFRKGMIHLLIGVTGGGKTTLRNAIILDFLKLNRGKRILVWQSEESTSDLETKLSHNEEIIGCSNLYCKSEPELVNGLNKKQIEEKFFEYPVIEDIDLMIFDNVTTSMLYGETPAQQSAFCDKLKNFVVTTDIPLLVLAHTHKNISKNSDRIIESNDIRGSARLVNIAEYTYILQQFQINTSLVTTLRPDKSRHHLVDDPFFKLNFDKQKQIYTDSMAISFEDFKEYWKHRNTFKDKR